MTHDHSPFDDPQADVIEVDHPDGTTDVVALRGEVRHLGFVSVDNTDPVRVVRRRPGLWRCDTHQYPKPPCRHIEDVHHALEHLRRQESTP